MIMFFLMLTYGAVNMGGLYLQNRLDDPGKMKAAFDTEEDFRKYLTAFNRKVGAVPFVIGLVYVAVSLAVARFPKVALLVALSQAVLFIYYLFQRYVSWQDILVPALLSTLFVYSRR